MDVLIKPLSSCENEIEIIVSHEELQPHFEKAYKKVRAEATIPGYRKGKVPMAIIRNRFGKMIEAEEIETISQEFFTQAMEERNIKPVGHPHMHGLDYKPGEPLTITIHYETLPEVTAHDYTGIEVEKIVHTVTDDEVEEEIDRQRKREQILSEVQTIDDENIIVTADIHSLDDSGIPIIGGMNKDMKIDLSDERVNRDLKAELLNMNLNEERDVSISFQDQEGNEKPDNLRVRIKKIEQIVLPEVTDEFVQRISGGKSNTVAEYRAELASSMQRWYDSASENRLQVRLVDEIVRRNPIDVPSVLVDNILEGFLEELKKEYNIQELPKDFNREEFNKQRKADAIWRAKWMLVSESIITQEKLTVEDSDVEGEAEREAAKTGIAKERLIQFLKQSPEVANKIQTKKLMDFLIAQAIVNAVAETDADEKAEEPSLIQL